MTKSKKQIRADYYLRNKAKENARSREYHWANRDKLCKDMIDRQYIRKYGMTAADKAAMLKAQGGKCAVCKSDTPGGRWGWVIDHNHNTGRVRGVLCHHCNTTIGNSLENVSRLEGIIKYLEADHGL